MDRLKKLFRWKAPDRSDIRLLSDAEMSELWGGEPMTILASVAAAGSVLKAVGGIKAGNDAVKAGSLQEQQDNQNAIQAQASAQRVAENQLHQGTLVKSRAQALAAASGGGATDTTVTGIISKIAGEAQYRSDVALYQGDEKARQFRLHGEAALAAGKSAQTQSYYGAAGSLLEAGSSLYGKLNKTPGPPTTPTASAFPDWSPGEVTRMGY